LERSENNLAVGAQMTSVDKQSQKRPSLKLNALSNFGGLAISILIGFFLTPVMLTYLGEKRFGIWTLVSSLVGYYGLLDFGVGAAIFRYVPLYHGQGNHHKVSSVISTSLAFYGMLSLVIVAVTQILAGPIANYFEGGHDLAVLLRIVGLATAVSLTTIVLNTSVISYEGFAPSNLVTTSAQALRGALLVGCMWAGFGLAAMGWTILIVNVLSLAANSLLFKRICTDARLSLSAVGWSELKTLMSFGAIILITSTANSLATESPKQIVAKTLSLESLGLFGILLLLIGYYRMLIISLTKVFSPRFSYLSGKQADDEIRRLFIQGCRYMALLAGAVLLGMWIIGPSFLVLWAKKPELVHAVPALAIMAGGTFVFLSHRLGGDLLFGLGRQNQIALLEFTEAAGIVGLKILLSRKYGMNGAAWGIAIPPIIVRGLLQVRFVSQALKLGFVQYYSRCILRAWLAVAIIWGLAQLFDWNHLITGWPSMILLSALLMLAYGAAVFFIALEAEEKRRLKQDLPRLVMRTLRLRAE
jgi:O-antigen/teichoic acid export membrane protein